MMISPTSLPGSLTAGVAELQLQGDYLLCSKSFILENTSILFYLPQKDKVISNLSSLVKKNWRRKALIRRGYLPSQKREYLKKKVSKDVALRVIRIRRNECVTWLYLNVTKI
ncbi:unnamed protein product [Rhizophagus irregularis]|nr:unnamed protein product [Rhizophagus irregularis]CAB4433737.1 unnamed protein product [Rhizophagus irregularis]